MTSKNVISDVLRRVRGKKCLSKDDVNKLDDRLQEFDSLYRNVYWFLNEQDLSLEPCLIWREALILCKYFMNVDHASEKFAYFRNKLKEEYEEFKFSESYASKKINVDDIDKIVSFIYICVAVMLTVASNSIKSNALREYTPKNLQNLYSIRGGLTADISLAFDSVNICSRMMSRISERIDNIQTDSYLSGLSYNDGNTSNLIEELEHTDDGDCNPDKIPMKVKIVMMEKIWGKLRIEGGKDAIKRKTKAEFLSIMTHESYDYIYNLLDSENTDKAKEFSHLYGRHISKVNDCLLGLQVKNPIKLSKK